MENSITLTIDGREVAVDEGTTILEAAEILGIHIPVICYHPHLTANGLCRICSVDSGGRVQSAACVSACSEGMKVKTDSEEVLRNRKTILELLSSTVNLEEAPEIVELMNDLDADPGRFSGGHQRESPIYDDNPFYIRDYNQCVNCWRCVQVCAEDAQYAFALSFDGRGFDTKIGTFFGDGMMDTTCVFCGQCVGVCPTGALKPKRQALLEIGENPDEIFFMTKQKRSKSKRRNHDRT
jgi:predicted molibdopterin-dependent oxidoreductase YjgC